MAQDDDDSKEFDPSQRKLDEARKKGDVPRSADLIATAGQAGFLLAVLALGSDAANRLSAFLAGLLRNADTLSADILGGGASAAGGAIFGTLATTMLPLFLVPGAMAIVAIVAQRSFAPSLEKVQMKGSRINPVENAKNKFGPNGLFEFAKSLVKLLTISVCLGLFLSGRLPDLIMTMGVPEQTGIQVLVSTLIGFLLISILVTFAIGLVDLLWQRHSHQQKLRMSRKEMMDESKQNDGDPHMKQKRRQKAYDIAMNTMLQDVPTADVIVVNPTHYAVALKWDRMPGRAPVCVAKGVDEVAARIREIAAESGVPIHRDPPTARALYATVDIGGEIHTEHYRTVAAAIRFAEQMRIKARQMKGKA